MLHTERPTPSAALACNTSACNLKFTSQKRKSSDGSITAVPDFSWMGERARKLARVEKFSCRKTMSVVDAISRYHFYIEHSIHDRHIAPFREEWLQNALVLLPDDLKNCFSEETLEEFLK